MPRVRAGWTLERGAALQLVRAVEAVIVIAVPSFVPRAGVLVPMAITYLVIVGIGEVIRRSGLPARRAVWRGWLLLCIDGAFLVTLAAHAQDRLGFARAAVLLRDEDGWRFVRSAGRFAHIEDVDTDPLVTRAWSTGSPELVQALEGRVLARVLPNAHNVVIAPVSVDDEPVGVVLAEWGQGHGARIPTTTVRSLTRSATHAALSLRNARLLADVEPRPH